MEYTTDYNKDDFALLPHKAKRVVLVLAIVALLLIAFTVWAHIVNASPNPHPGVVAVSTPAPTYPIPSEVLPIVQRLGIDQTAISHLRITVPPNADSCVGHGVDSVSACFKPGNLIIPQTVLSLTTSQQNSIVAHEYLHATWENMTPAEREALRPLIEQAYQNAKPYLDKRISHYDFAKEGPDTRINELHSFVGTEIADNLIPPALLDHYKSLLPNRNALPSLYPYPTPAPVYVAPKRQPICVPNYTYSIEQGADGQFVSVRTYTGTTCYP